MCLGEEYPNAAVSYWSQLDPHGGLGTRLLCLMSIDHVLGDEPLACESNVQYWEDQRLLMLPLIPLLGPHGPAPLSSSGTDSCLIPVDADWGVAVCKLTRLSGTRLQLGVLFHTDLPFGLVPGDSYCVKGLCQRLLFSEIVNIINWNFNFEIN